MGENVKDLFCEKDIILDQFNSKREYEKFAKESLEEILERRKIDKESEKELFFE